ncbi:MAG: hypothetical protein JO337_03565 [Acidimicrobiales bacterium]|nr:hypothetical protein [Acidimicrobiales bacterium]
MYAVISDYRKHRDLGEQVELHPDEQISLIGDQIGEDVTQAGGRPVIEHPADVDYDSPPIPPYRYLGMSGCMSPGLVGRQHSASTFHHLVVFP